MQSSPRNHLECIRKFHEESPNMYAVAVGITDRMSILASIYNNRAIFESITGINDIYLSAELDRVLSVKRDKQPVKLLLVQLTALGLYVLATYEAFLEMTARLAEKGVVKNTGVFQIIDERDHSKIVFVCSARSDLTVYDKIRLMAHDRYQVNVTRCSNYFCIHTHETVQSGTHELQTFYDYLTARGEIEIHECIHRIEYMTVGAHKCRRVICDDLITAKSGEDLRSKSCVVICINVPLSPPRGLDIHPPSVLSREQSDKTRPDRRDRRDSKKTKNGLTIPMHFPQ